LRFSRELIEDIKKRSDIVSIVREYVKNFKKSGKKLDWIMSVS